MMLSRMMTNGRVFVYLHIDRTGGSSLREYLAMHFRRDAIMPVPHHPETQYQPINYPAAPPDLHAAHDQFESTYHKSHLLVMGHWDWSVVDRLCLMGHDPVVITVLRDPVERFMSLVRHIRQHPHIHPTYSKMDMVHLAHRYPLYGDAMTLQLAGVRWGHGRHHKPTMYDYERAITNLAKRDVHVFRCGETEQMIGELRFHYDFEKDPIPHVNATTRHDDVPDAIREIVTRNTRFDRALWSLYEPQSRSEHQRLSRYDTA